MLGFSQKIKYLFRSPFFLCTEFLKRLGGDALGCLLVRRRGSELKKDVTAIHGVAEQALLVHCSDKIHEISLRELSKQTPELQALVIS